MRIFQTRKDDYLPNRVRVAENAGSHRRPGPDPAPNHVPSAMSERWKKHPAQRRPTRTGMPAEEKETSKIQGKNTLFEEKKEKNVKVYTNAVSS